MPFILAFCLLITDPGESGLPANGVVADIGDAEGGDDSGHQEDPRPEQGITEYYIQSHRIMIELAQVKTYSTYSFLKNVSHNKYMDHPPS